MTLRAVVSGTFKIDSGQEGFPASLIVTVDGSPQASSFILQAPIVHAASAEDAISQALVILDSFGQDLRRLAQAEHARLVNGPPPASMLLDEQAVDV